MIYATNYETIEKQGVLPMENKVLVYTTRGNPPKGVQPLGKYVVHLKDLAPSTGLFYTYVKHLKAGEWCKEKFLEVYKQRFINEIKSNPRAMKILTKLVKHKMSTEKTILLVCYCDNNKLQEQICHNNILIELISEL